MAIAFLGLGSNMGNRIRNLSSAVKSLSEQTTILQVSSVYETEPVGYLRQRRFLNAVARISTVLSPEQLLCYVKDIEHSGGRTPAFRNAPRPIDIDILFYDDIVCHSEQLTIPHPRLVERAFVLVPLSEIAPERRHPDNGKTPDELLHSLDNITGVTKWSSAEKLWNRRQHVPGIS
jgi:2-amino-4-hydroxy-6-hydroxymethyldihydropteridine diphosphokinase